MSDNLGQVALAVETLRTMAEHGTDFAETRHVIHYFYGGNFDALARNLAELGYELYATAENDGVIAERYEVIGEEWRVTTLKNLCEMADSYGVEYDGWEASIQAMTGPEHEAGEDESN